MCTFLIVIAALHYDNGHLQCNVQQINNSMHAIPTQSEVGGSTGVVDSPDKNAEAFCAPWH